MMEDPLQIDTVEIIHECDNKEMSIGMKRDKLIWNAKGKYLVMIDDDDWIAPQFIRKILDATVTSPDCIGYMEECRFGNRIERSMFSNRFTDWSTLTGEAFKYARTPFFKTPIRTDYCKVVGCRDMRFGEDHDFAKRIKPLLKTEVFINEIMYIYRYKDEPHNEKYGIK